jgi:hypothetical protein
VEAEWILFLDADERVRVELALEICEKLSRPERGWWIPRHNFIFGRLTLGAGWYPDYQLRLLHRKSAHYNTARPVHEEVILEGLAGYLENPITHYNYLNLQQFISKQEKYIDFEAGIRYEAGLRPKLWTYATMPFRQFVWRYLALQGWRMGLHGVRLSALMAYYEFQTWVRVRKRIGKRTL